MRAAVTRPSVNEARQATRLVAICFVVALFEGLDIQSMGVAAPKLVRAFGLRSSELGLVLSASILGMMIGAAVGGRLSDRVGRKTTLILSTLTLGLFSLMTTLAWDQRSLVIMRLITGLGLGGVFPTLIAMVSEATLSKARVTALGLMYCGLPAGGAIIALVGAAAVSAGWRSVFYLGGLGPLLIVPLLVYALADDRRGSAVTGTVGTPSVPAASVGTILFGTRAATTALLWISYFFTLLVVYTLLNWLPSLLLEKGFTAKDALFSSVMLNIGAVLGSIVLGKLMDRAPPWTVVVTIYAGMAAALAALVVASGPVTLLCAFFAGFFVIGGQLVLYALAPMFYPPEGRGTGIGAAVAVGRIGSVSGPLLAGELLTRGLGADTVLKVAVSGLMLALAAAFILGLKLRSAAKLDRPIA